MINKRPMPSEVLLTALTTDVLCLLICRNDIRTRGSSHHSCSSASTSHIAHVHHRSSCTCACGSLSFGTAALQTLELVSALTSKVCKSKIVP